MNRTFNKVISILLAIALLIPSGWLAPVAKAATPDIPVLLYHRIVTTPTDDTHTSVANFKKHMNYLTDNGYTTLTAEQYVDIMKNGATAPAKPILLTFDDATPDFITDTVPILELHGMKAIQFVITDWIDKGYSMSLEQLKMLVKDHPNISVQNHSVYHANNAWNSMLQGAASTEIAQANVFIKGITGKDPILLAYPYGQYNVAAQAAAQANGIKYSFKVGYPNQGDHAMGRYYIQMNTTLSQIANWIGGPAPAPESGSGGQTNTTTVYHETFASGKGLAMQSGNASLTPVTGKVFAGNADGAALYVSNRAHDYDAADFKFSDIGLENGKTYTVTATVYVDADVTLPSGAQAYLQTVSSYGFLAGGDFIAGSALTLTKEFTVDTSKDTSLRVQSSADGATVPFYIGDILITQKVDPVIDVETPRPPALNFSSITFEDQTAGGFVGRNGTEILTVTNEANHTDSGSSALKVEGRTTTWHGPSLRVEKFVNKGYEYKITAWVKLISPGSSQLQLSTQVGNTSASYNTVDKKTISTDDGWVKFEGTYRYNTIPDEYLSLYVESASNSTAAFYIDDISFEQGSGPKSVQDLTPIKDVYQDDFLIGNAVSAADLDGARLELLKKHNNVVTAENVMKPDQTYNANKQFDFTANDALIDKIQAAGLKLHGHVLVWHQQTPEWLNTTTDAPNNPIPLGRDEALTNMRTHIETVMGHYANKVISWDVVNEAMNDNPPNPTDWKASLRQSPWKSAIGDDYVEQAFLAAREVLDANPAWNIQLYYNDYNDDNQNKASAIYSMVKEINDKYALTHPGKLLIDGVGMQGHYNLNTNPNNVKLSMEKFISLGVEVSISELDITAGSNSQLSAKEANAQGYLYAQLFNIFKAHAAYIGRVTFWGLNDATSWRASQNPQLFDKDLQAKPAYYGVIDPDTFRAAHPPEAAVEVKQSTAQFATPIIDGTVDAVWSQAPDILINQYQMAWQGASGVAKALWDDQNLYVLIQVSDKELDKSSLNAYEQDSVEIFLDENNAKTSRYEEDDGQYRINFDNEASFNPAKISAGFESKTLISGTNYTVEVKIPLKSVKPANGMRLGFDLQINDAKGGARQSVATWNDLTGNGFQDTTNYGLLNLTGADSNPSPVVVTGVSLDQPTLTMTAGGATATLNATISPENATNKTVTWSSSNTAVATVGANGVVTPVAAGNATITVTTSDGGFTAMSTVTVNAPSESTPRPSTQTPSTSAPSTPIPPTALPVPTITVGNEDVKVKATPDSLGRASVSISSNDLQKAIENAKNNILKIQVEPAVGLKSVTVKLPTEQIMGLEGKIHAISIDTGLATVTIDLELLKNSAILANGNLELSVTLVDTDSLPELVRNQVEANNVYDFNLSVNGTKITNFDGNEVKVSFNYSLKQGGDPNKVVIYFIDENGILQIVKDGKYNGTTGKVEFKPKHFSKYAAVLKTSHFQDLNSVPWALESIEALEAREIITGMEKGSFSPDNKVTRAQFIQMLMGALDLIDVQAISTFGDVKSGAWYYQAIATAQKLGIVNGKADGTYGINDNISRQEMAAMLYRAALKAGVKLQSSASTAVFTDNSEIAEYAADAITALQKAGIVEGMQDGKFAPILSATRAEAAVMIYRFFNLLP